MVGASVKTLMVIWFLGSYHGDGTPGGNGSTQIMTWEECSNFQAQQDENGKDGMYVECWPLDRATPIHRWQKAP